MNRTYRTARLVFDVLEVLAWMAVVLGVAVAVWGFASGGLTSLFGVRNMPMEFRFFAALPGLGAAISGILIVALVQYFRAGVDTAEMTSELVRVARAQQRHHNPDVGTEPRIQ